MSASCNRAPGHRNCASSAMPGMLAPHCAGAAATVVLHELLVLTAYLLHEGYVA